MGGVPVSTEPDADSAWAELPEAQPVAAVDTDAAPAEALDAGPRTELLADPFADDPAPVPAPAEPAPQTEFPEPPSEPEPTEPAAARRLAAESELENADTFLMPPPYAPTAAEPAAPSSPPTAESGLSDNSLIMAVVCQYGHPSPQNATHCRTCGSPIAPQGPQLVPRPVLAVLRSSGKSVV